MGKKLHLSRYSAEDALMVGCIDKIEMEEAGGETKH